MLKTWITGTKDIEDQGLSQSVWINDNVTIIDGGKLGKCMSFNGSTSRLSTTNYSLSNKWSFSCWVKDDATVSSWQMVLGLNNNGSDSDLQMGLWLKSNENRLEFSYNGVYNSGIGYTVGQWNHFVGTYDGASAKFYINGILKATMSNTGNLPRTNLTIGGRCASANGGHSSFGHPFKGLVNDLRIWENHALSPMEVKQISQGLVLHYPLDNNGWGQENIFKKTREVFDNNGARLSSTTINNGLIIDSNAPNGKYRSWNVVAENNVNRGIYYTYTNSNIALEDLTANEIYTLSFWSRCSKTKNLIVSSLVESQTVQKVDSGDVPSSGNIVVGNKWERHSVTFKWISTSKITTCFYLRSLDETVTLDIASPKLEKGSITTPWCPNSSDALATAMGMNDGIEYDCSGFENNGTRVGNFSWSSDTPRYLSSTQFNGGKYIEIPFPCKTISENLTVSIWGYEENWNTPSAERLIGAAFNTSGWCIGDYGSENSLFGFYANGSYNTALGFKQLSSGWHHFVITFNGYNLQYYVDSEQFYSKTFSTRQVVTGDYNIIIGRHANGGCYFNGRISDVRVYATALSAEDVQKLYSVSAVIDSQGNTFASSYVEG